MKDKLIEAVINNKNHIPYINLTEDNKYRGWTSDFRISINAEKNMFLDLSKENDLFLLFILASFWSRSTNWENAAFFTTYLKANKLDIPNIWKDKELVLYETTHCKENAKKTIQSCTGIVPRKKVSFRSDIFASIEVIVEHWDEIILNLERANRKNDYLPFIMYISEIKGLGFGEKRMKIKVPLILRELRCQNIFSNIPGKYCCVPDKRVVVTAKEIGFYLPVINSTKSILKASKLIYENFGDLYDIPLFAYEDIKEQIK
ncbi:hypothetical protein Q5O14_08495 [Eubacteriaceae bacterium ES2]|nr:hypothetical protein Q5O14_08495 [Eubacteriaceae bacterium ES2]